MRAGASISAAGHGAVLFLALFGGFDRVAPSQPEFDIASIELISDAEFRALQPRLSEPENPAELEQPISVASPLPGPESAEPELTDPPEPDVPSEPPPEPVEAEIPDPPAQPDPPIEVLLAADEEAADDRIAEPPAPVDDREVVSVSETETQPEAPARQAAEKISSEAVPETENTVQPDDPAPQVAVTEFQLDETEPAESAEEAVREHTATETVTEADETEAKALQLTRPARRPPRPPADPESPEPTAESPRDTEPSAASELEPTARPEPEPTPEPPVPQSDTEEIDIAALISQSMQESESAGEGLGAPLIASEREGLKRVVQKCWNLAALSDEAKRITVLIGVELETDGRPVPGSIKLLEASPASSSAAAARAFEAGRRAIRRCLRNGHDGLPREKYDTWRRVEFEFNPDEMRNR